MSDMIIVKGNRRSDGSTICNIMDSAYSIRLTECLWKTPSEDSVTYYWTIIDTHSDTVPDVFRLIHGEADTEAGAIRNALAAFHLVMDTIKQVTTKYWSEMLQMLQSYEGE